MIILADVKGISMSIESGSGILSRMKKRLFRGHLFFCAIVFPLLFGSCSKNTEIPTCVTKAGKSPIPVILDTDLGDDIDDTWALAFLLKCPEFDIRMILSATGDTELRAKMIAKVLDQCGRTDIPIGIGKPTKRAEGHPYFQRSWVDDYDMAGYKGKVYPDGVGAMIDIIMESEKPVTVIAIGPLPNLAEALRRQPLITKKSNVVGMLGSVRRGYNHSEKIEPEWNVVMYVEDAQTVFNSPWPMTITPLDTCGIVKLQGQKYQQVLQSDKPEAKVILDAYRSWLDRPGHAPEKSWDINQSSSVLFDTVAVYLAMSTDLLQMETLGLSVDKEGYTIINENAKKINCAMEWKGLNAFEDFLVWRIAN
jgi:inosine-uridine nucleoside N-ribohydrolase